jgi:hypothetical protein
VPNRQFRAASKMTLLYELGLQHVYDCYYSLMKLFPLYDCPSFDMQRISIIYNSVMIQESST